MECLVRTGKRWAQGSRGTAQTITLTEDDGIDNVVSVTNNTTVTLWDVASGPITGFEACQITPSVDMFVVLVCDKGGEVGIMRFALRVRAGHPLTLTSDVAKANFTTDVSTGTNDFIETIQIRNETGGTGYVNFNIAN